jgi:Flp pilus assembly protein TadD
MAYAYLDVANYEKAMDHALLEYNRRPNNIDVNETLAWVCYKKGDFKKAQSYIKTALQTDCKNPALLCHVGLIYAAAGDNATAKNYLQQALKNNPNISPLLKFEAQRVLRSI